MMTFRKATPADLPTLNTISLASKKHWGYPEDWVSHWTEELTLTSEKLTAQSVMIGQLDSKPVGFCAIAEEPDQYEILHLWLLPEFIGQGYGKKLLQQTLAEFTKTDKPVLVEADPHAETFYQRQGFRTIGWVESYPQGRFLPVMTKSADHHQERPHYDLIRRYRPADQPAILALFRSNTPDFFAPEEEQDLIAYLSKEAEHYFVYEKAGAIIAAGGCSYGFDQGTTARIAWDFVRPDHHGQGVGARLIRFRVGEIRKQPGVRRIIVRTSQLAHGFYGKMGFQLEKVELDYWAEGFDLYLMSMELGPD